MKYWILRRLYEFCYWLCDKMAPPEAPVYKGFYTRFKKPQDVQDKDLGSALKKLLEEADKD